MTSTKPWGVWQWLLLLAPAVVMIIVCAFIPAHIDSANSEIHGENAIGVQLAWAFYGFIAAFLLSIGLGFWLTPEEGSCLSRGGRALVFGVLILFVNLLAAGLGCMMVGYAVSK